MAYIYQADQVVEFEDGQRVPVYPNVAGIKALRWRWIAENPWWYFETEKPLIGAVAAPATYPNGVALESCPNVPWQEPVAEAKP